MGVNPGLWGGGGASKGNLLVHYCDVGHFNDEDKWYKKYPNGIRNSNDKLIYTAQLLRSGNRSALELSVVPQPPLPATQ